MNASIMLLFYGAIFAVIYFFFIRPQSQKIKEGKKFIDKYKKETKYICPPVAFTALSMW